MNNYIVATNFSENCDEALEIAWRLSKEERKKITVLHLNPVPENLENYNPEVILEETWNKKVETRINKRLSEQLGRLKIPKQAVDFDIVTGKISESLPLYLLEKNCSDTILLLGRSYEGEIYHLLYGGFLKTVIKKSFLDVMVVNKKLEHLPTHIAITVRANQPSEIVLNRALSFAKNYNCEISLISVLPLTFMEASSEEIFSGGRENDIRITDYIMEKRLEAQSEIDKIANDIESKGFNVRAKVKVGLNELPQDTIKEYFFNHPVDFVFMGQQDDSFEELATNSVSLALIRELDSNIYLCKR